MSIMDSFMVAKECISFFQKKKIPAVLYKVNFAKAFDTVSWTFLTNLLIERDFPPLWLACLLRLLRSSSSSIKINGEFTDYFTHKRGLRQGDPLSPLLFIIAVEALQSFISNVAPLTSGPIIIAPRALQYADDTIILMEAFPRNLQIFKLILANFVSLTGLHINDSKCLFVPIAIPQALITTVHQTLACQQKSLPITYLGLPLSIRRLKKIHFKPLIDAVQRRLDRWQSRFLSFGGRLTLVKSVLTAMPIHYMQTILLPAWLIKHLEGMRRKFFWKDKDKCLRGHCLVNWSKCCMLKKNRGLGIISLLLQNQALLTKWLWKISTDENSLWTSTIRELYGTTDIDRLSSLDEISNGFKDILRAYRILADTGVRSSYHPSLWKIKAPLKVRIFLWLLLQNRLLTQENLLLRGWPAIQSCITCQTPTMETAPHLFIHCPFAHRLWDMLQTRLNLPVINFTADLVGFWLTNRSLLGDQWDIIWAAASWALWKERNARIFSAETSIQSKLLGNIIKDMAAWTIHF
ncbi:hypothetical protein LUZ63_015142 [Rhynchospora breviuscula]|uniref:Reverse transcriptase domain-containing protein n=1 Tax=Rhynchospora breviuscula TaxID=2022672 RepID=A0A9Q0HLU9_9POAL|nr:hypothetical protein LUZ63_015142 [Rhynchospora breviuscula]